MADIQRTADAIWNGDLRGGNGQLSTQSGTLDTTPYAFASRFEHGQGTNPEELLAAAHAGCFSMAFAATLSRKGFKPESIHTHATCSLSPQQPTGFKITKMLLKTEGRVPEIDEAAFKEIATEVGDTCLVSQVLTGLEIEVEASLLT